MIFSRLPKKVLAVIGVGTVLMVEAADFLTGHEIAFSIFYLVVVIYFAWYFGRKIGLVASLITAFLSVITDIMVGLSYSHFLIPVWTVLMRASIFGVVALLLGRLKSELIKEKRSNLRLLQAYEEIKKLSELKTQFMAVVSHELRTPMTAIKESIRIVNSEMKNRLDSEQACFLDITQKNIERLNRLLDDMLDFSQLETRKIKFHFSPVNLNHLILETSKLHKGVAAKTGQEIRCELDARVPIIHADSDRIVQVLNNLIHNALKFAGEGQIIIGSRLKGQNIEIYVKDHGPGISKENQKRIFEPFVRIETGDAIRSNGTGLGLAISKQIAEQHEGTMSVQSEPGRGAIFSFTLPLFLKKGL